MKKRIHHRIPYPDFSPAWLDFFSDNGVFPEIYFSAESLESATPEKLLTLEKELHGRHLGTSLHAPFLDLAVGAFDPKIREVTAYRLRQILDVAEVLKPNVINLHAHYERHRYGGQLDLWLEHSARTLAPLVQRAEKSKTILALENVFEEEPSPLDRLIRKIGSPSLKACFDNGHFHMFHKVPLKKWWEVLGDQTVCLHLHDNHGDRDEHLPIGDGNFPFPSYFGILKTYRHEMTYTLESKGIVEAKKSLKALRKLLEAEK